MTGYAVTNAPKFAAMQEFDCAACGHETLARPVFLVTPEGRTIATGTGCAAKLLELPVANVAADHAEGRLIELINAAPMLTNAWSMLLACLPVRVGPKFLADMAARCWGVSPDQVAEVAECYKVIRKVRPVRSVRLPAVSA